ncbi:MAG: hypothetical protein AAF035_02320 [Pseudomonadota bacterium]
MERSLSDWNEKLRGTAAQDLLSSWSKRVQVSTSYLQEPNYHIAVAERMRNLAYMSIDLEDDLRLELRERGNAILAAVRDIHAENGKLVRLLDETRTKSDAYFDKYGSKTARTYMYERGLISLSGDRMATA